MTTSENSPENLERHATNLELFLDLVFVFTVTQITSVLADDVSWAGALRALVLAWLAWWQWTAFTWLGTAVDLHNTPKARVMVLGMIPAVLVMAIAMPTALTTHGKWFAGAYFIVQVWTLLIQGVDAHRSPAHFRSWTRYAPLALLAPLVVLGGSFASGDARLAWWAVAAVLFVLSAVLGGRSGSDRGEWSIDPTHFAERHALFMIIVLGEVLVAVGATSTALGASKGLSAEHLLGIIAAVGMACAMWWAYFAYVPKAFEHALASLPPSERGTMARDFGSFGHFPAICGVVAFAVVAKHMVMHPYDGLSNADLVLLFVSGLLFLGSMIANQWRVTHTISRVRLVTIGAFGAISLLGTMLPGVATVGAYAAAAALAATIIWRNVIRSDFAAEIGLV